MDEVLRNTNKKMLSKWSHQNIFAHFLVLTRPKRCYSATNARELTSVKTRLPSTRGGLVKCELRVASCELRVASYELRVAPVLRVAS